MLPNKSTSKPDFKTQAREIQLEEGFRKPEREDRKTDEGRNREVVLDVEAVRRSEQSGYQVGICSHVVTDD